MRSLLLGLFFLAQPFWESKSPEQWTEAEVEAVRYSSPWVQSLGPEPGVLVWLATAAPIEEAEAQARLRTRRPEVEPDPDYIGYVTRNRDRSLVLAIAYPGPRDLVVNRLGTRAEQGRMAEESKMIVGRKAFHLLGYFPPTLADPVLRLVFPLEAKPSDRAVLFQLYLSGIPFPERQVEFRLKDLTYRGKLEM